MLLTSMALTQTDARRVRAQSLDKDKVHRVEAAYLYNFAKFIQWPSDVFERADSPFVIAVLGEKSFGNLIRKTVRAKTIAGHAIQVKQVKLNNNKIREVLESCHILYISSTEQHRVPAILAALVNRPMLLVSDAKDFARAGGMIGLVLENGRLVFEINRASLYRAKLKASSKLMKLARVVDTAH